jgi:hypothetical protein
MTTRIQFLSGVRAELQDAGPVNYVWSDSLLQAFLNEGLNRLSLDLPPVAEITLAAVMGQRDYVLGPEIGWLIAVEFPAGCGIAPGNTGPQYGGVSPLAAGDYQPFEQRWELINGLGDLHTLRFRYGLTQTGDIVVRALTTYSLPAADSSVLDLKAFDEAALKWAVCARAVGWLEEARAKRQGGSGPGSRESSDYYRHLYAGAVQARKQLKGIGSSQVVVDG